MNFKTSVIIFDDNSSIQFTIHIIHVVHKTTIQINDKTKMTLTIVKLSNILSTQFELTFSATE